MGGNLFNLYHDEDGDEDEDDHNNEHDHDRGHNDGDDDDDDDEEMRRRMRSRRRRKRRRMRMIIIMMQMITMMHVGAADVSSYFGACVTRQMTLSRNGVEKGEELVELVERGCVKGGGGQY